jgi:hypothetical protein
LAQEIEKKISLADMSLEELAAELARLPKTSEQASMSRRNCSPAQPDYARHHDGAAHI